MVGTRSAAFAPVHDLGLVAIWDDGDDLHAEPRAPYPHTRETLLLRAEREGAAALVGGFARSVEAEYLLRTGWAHEIAAAARAAARAGSRCAVAGATEHALDARPARRRGSRARRTRRSGPALERRAGAGADPARRLRPRPGLRPLPHAGPVPACCRARSR